MLRKPFVAIVLNGLFFPTAGRILGAGLLLTWFVADLTTSTLLVSALIPLQYGASLLAQPWIGQWMSQRRPRVRTYRTQALVRAAVWIALALVIAAAPLESPALLAVFFLVVTVDAVAAGVGNIAFSDTLARVIPSTLRGRARGARGMAGAIVAGTTGILVHRFVSPESSLGTFALLFAVAGALYAVGGMIFGLIDEPVGREAAHRPSRRHRLADRVRAMLATPGYRRFLGTQALLIPATQGLTFFSLFGRREFELDLKALGLLLVSDALAPLLGNAVWGRMADRLGNPIVLATAALLSLAAPAVALALAFSDSPPAGPLVLAAFGAIVFALGAAAAGVDLASKNLILELAPDDRERPVFIGVNDTLVAAPTLLLILGGPVIDGLGYRPLFVAMAFLTAAAAGLAMGIPHRRARMP